MALWLEDATPLPAGDDGGSMLGGPSKLVWHTTEGATAGGAIAAMRERDTWAHLTATYETGTLRVWQHIPLDRACRALRHPAGTVQTNRAGHYCVQVEVVGWASSITALPPAYFAGLARLARTIEQATGIPRRSTVRWLPYPESYGADNGVRLSPAAWLDYAGHLGHQHVPGNLHGDPGALPIGAILALPMFPGGLPMSVALIRVKQDPPQGAVYLVESGHLLHIDTEWLAAFAAAAHITISEARGLIIDLDAGDPLWALPKSG
jgi:hypothetical protein